MLAVSWVILRLIVWERVSHWIWYLPVQLDWLTSDFWGSACFWPQLLPQCYGYRQALVMLCIWVLGSGLIIMSVQQTLHQLSHISSSWVSSILWILPLIWASFFPSVVPFRNETFTVNWVWYGSIYVCRVILCWTQFRMSEAQKRRSPSFIWRHSKLIFRKK